MTLGTEVELGPGHIVLYGIQLPSPKRGRSPQPNFRPISIVAKGLHGCHLQWSRPQARRLCVRWRPSPSPKRGRSPPIFSPCLMWPNGCMDQDATWYGGRPWPRRHCVRWGPSSPSPKRGPSPRPNFRHMSIVAKRLDASRWHLAWRWALVQATLC